MTLLIENHHVCLDEFSVDSHDFIARFELFFCFHKTIASHSRPDQFDDLVIDRRRNVTEQHQTVNTSGESDAMIELVEFKASKNVTRKERFDDLIQLARELVVLVDSQLRRQRFQMLQGLQVAAGALFLFQVGVNDIPAKTISNFA